MESYYRCFKEGILKLNHLELTNICNKLLENDYCDNDFTFIALQFYKEKVYEILKNINFENIDIKFLHYKIRKFPLLGKIILENTEDEYLISYINSLIIPFKLGDFNKINEKHRDILIKTILGNDNMDCFLIPLEFRTLELCKRFFLNKPNLPLNFCPINLIDKIIDYAFTKGTYRNMKCNISEDFYNNLNDKQMLNLAITDVSFFTYITFTSKIEKIIILSLLKDEKQINQLNTCLITTNIMKALIMKYGLLHIKNNYKHLEPYWINSEYLAINIIREDISNYIHFSYYVRSDPKIIRYVITNMKYNTSIIDYIPNKNDYRFLLNRHNLLEFTDSIFRFYDLNSQLSLYPYEAYKMVQKGFEEELEQHHIQKCVYYFPETITYFNKIYISIEMLKNITYENFIIILDKIDENVSTMVFFHNLHLKRKYLEILINNVKNEEALIEILNNFPYLLKQLNSIPSKKVILKMLEFNPYLHHYFLENIEDFKLKDEIKFFIETI